ncbi:BBM_1a_G0027560.mRNA.1.CDS.1 [Saccharomyces cerevisiae]|nr:BBM_1a_G0027560.mRNA.1.CDS.1 [Saccharomyces cerevisiae]CAI7095483.1 BBM_1a_G0027560.mRNA.1.CDS.1 [Saccharomyces cerevisiae]
MNDNEVKDEKSVDVFSLKHLESQKIILPQDLFRNCFTWVYYEIYKSLAFRIWLLLWFPLSVWWKMSSNWIYPFIASFLLLFSGLIFAPFIHFLFRKRALSKQLTQFSKEIIKYTPGTDIHDWEVIATNLNSYLYENKAWHTKYLFFNAADCQEAFRTALLEPFSLKKDEAAKVKSFKDSVPYIEEALQVYFEEVDNQWKLFNTEKAWCPVGLEDIQLPKETHRFKLTWILKRILTINSLPSFLAFLNCVYVSRNFCPLFRILYLGWILFMLVQGFQNIRVLIMKMEHKIQFLSIIINEPESGANGWDAIAKKMNRYLFEEKLGKTKNFFSMELTVNGFFATSFTALYL